jgi:enamine deaminase RidA (YjgF/YER057c/UK114 family)
LSPAPLLRMTSCFFRDTWLTTRSVSVREQTQQVLASIDRLLGEAGSDKTRIVTATVYLSDIATFDEMNRAWKTRSAIPDTT